MFECEFHDNSIGLGRKQEEYNEQIKISQAFIMLIGEKVGQYTLEEYQVALQSKVPNIYVLFKDVKHNQAVKDFQKRLDVHVDIIKDKANVMETDFEQKVNAFTFHNISEMKFYVAKAIENLCKSKINIIVNENEIIIEDKYVKF